MHLEIAKTIHTSVFNNLKRRTNLLNGSRCEKELEEINTLGKKIREVIPLWKEYTQGLPLMIGGVDILCHLDNEDNSLTRNFPSISEQTNISITDKFVNTAPTPSPTLSSRIPRPSSSKSPPAITRRKSLTGSTSGTTTKEAVARKVSVTTHTAKRIMAPKSLSPIDAKDPNVVPAVADKKVARRNSNAHPPQMSGEKGFPMPRFSESRGGKRTVASRG